MATAEGKPKSDAMKNYEDNLDQIMAFIEQIKSAGLLEAGKKLQRTLMKEVASAPKISAKRLERAGARFKEAVDKWCDDEAVRKVQHLWDTRNLIVHSQCVASSAYVGQRARAMNWTQKKG
jgi:hypothetical protein